VNRYSQIGYFKDAIDRFQENRKSDVDPRVFIFIEHELKKLNIVYPSRDDIKKILDSYDWYKEIKEIDQIREIYSNNSES